MSTGVGAGCHRGDSPEHPYSSAQRAEARHQPAQPDERYHHEHVRLAADDGAELTLLREAIAGGESRGWRLISAVKVPGGEEFLVTWDLSGSPSG